MGAQDLMNGFPPPRVMLQRATDRLPIGFAELEADARADSHRHLTRLAVEFADCPAMFHAIFAGYLDGELAAIGAITDEPVPTPQPRWRMRRLYVHRKFRRSNVARAIAMALLQEAAGRVDTVTVHSDNDGADRFWQAIGFRRAVDSPWSHETPTSGATARAEAPPVALSPDERAAVAESKAAASRGEFATDEQVRATWAKRGL